MSFSSRTPKRKSFLVPPHLSRASSAARSNSSEDSLAVENVSHQGSIEAQRLTAPRSRPNPEMSRVAVRLTASLQQRVSYQATGHQVLQRETESKDPIVSDVSPPFERGSTSLSQTLVPSAQPSSEEQSPVPAPRFAKRGRGRPRGSGLNRSTFKQFPTTAAGSRQARQHKPVPHPAGFPKRRGRPPREVPPSSREVYESLEVPFVVFLCEWKGCPAELHNLDTLRRHVYRIHGEGDRPHCSWGTCGDSETGLIFETEEAFRAHMEEAHLVPFAWHVGDGPCNQREIAPRAAEEEIPKYLKDADGNQVTPSVRDQEIEDIVTWRSNQRKLKELLRRRDENLPSEEETADEVMDEDMS